MDILQQKLKAFLMQHPELSAERLYKLTSYPEEKVENPEETSKPAKKGKKSSKKATTERERSPSGTKADIRCRRNASEAYRKTIATGNPK